MQKNKRRSGRNLGNLPLPRGNLVGQAMRRTHLASYFGIGQSLSDDVRGKRVRIAGHHEQVVRKL